METFEDSRSIHLIARYLWPWNDTLWLDVDREMDSSTRWREAPQPPTHPNTNTQYIYMFGPLLLLPLFFIFCKNPRKMN